MPRAVLAFLRRIVVEAPIVLGDGSPQPQQRPADAHPLAGRWEPPHGPAGSE